MLWKPSEPAELGGNAPDKWTQGYKGWNSWQRLEHMWGKTLQSRNFPSSSRAGSMKRTIPSPRCTWDYVCWEEQGTEPWRKQHPCGSLAWDMLPDGLVIAQGKGETESHLSRPRQALRNSWEGSFIRKKKRQKRETQDDEGESKLTSRAWERCPEHERLIRCSSEIFPSSSSGSG